MSYKNRKCRSEERYLRVGSPQDAKRWKTARKNRGKVSPCGKYTRRQEMENCTKEQRKGISVWEVHQTLRDGKLHERTEERYLRVGSPPDVKRRRTAPKNRGKVSPCVESTRRQETKNCTKEQRKGILYE